MATATADMGVPAMTAAGMAIVVTAARVAAMVTETVAGVAAMVTETVVMAHGVTAGGGVGTRMMGGR
jgi:hypothetical protein